MVDTGGRVYQISKQVHKFILSLPEDHRRRIKEAIFRLTSGEVHGLDVKKLKPHPNDFRLRVGSIRILFTADKKRLFIYKAGFRGDVYK